MVLCYFGAQLIETGFGWLMLASVTGASKEGPNAYGPQPVETLTESVHVDDAENEGVDGPPAAEDTLSDSKPVA